MELKHGERTFHVKYAPIPLSWDSGSANIHAGAEESIFFEKGIDQEKIIETLMFERGERPAFTWQNKFKLTEGTVEWEEKKAQVPGLLIRYSDSADFEAHHRIVQEYNGGVAKIHLDEHTWDLRNPGTRLPHSRQYFTLRKGALTPQGEEIDKGVPEALDEILTKTDGLVYETLTTEGVRAYSPNQSLLHRALQSPIVVGISCYKLTDMAVCSFLYKRLQEKFDAEEREAMKIFSTPEAKKMTEGLRDWAEGLRGR